MMACFAIFLVAVLYGAQHLPASHARRIQQLDVNSPVDRGAYNNTDWDTCALDLLKQHKSMVLNYQVSHQPSTQQQRHVLEQSPQPPQQPLQQPSQQRWRHRCAQVLHSHLHAGFEYMVPLRERLRGISMEGGDRERLRAAFHKLVTGQPFKVVLLGGSITYGHGALHKPEAAWARRLKSWLEGRFPNAVVYNGALPGVGSEYMSLCLKVHCPADPDLVVLEFALNDDGLGPEVHNRKGLEKMIRSLLPLRNLPAVAMLNAYLWTRYNGVWWSSHEGAILDMAQYYGLPVISTRAALYHTFQMNVTGYRVDNVVSKAPESEILEYFNGDGDHPAADTGHRAYADLLITFFMHNMHNMVMQPLLPEELEIIKAPLPPPVIPGNFPAENNNCLVGEFLKDVVVGKEGFEWLNDRPPPKTPKWGFISNTSGSSIKFAFSLGSAGSAATPAMKQVQLVYLKSYEHMGRANVTCEAGCSCAPTILEGHDGGKKESQVHLLLVDVTPTATATQSTDNSKEQASATADPNNALCTVVVKVLPETASGEWKVKITGMVVMSERSTFFQDSPHIFNVHL